MGEGPAGDQIIVFNCPTCGQTIKVSRELAGKKGKCNQCGATVTVSDGKADMEFQPFAELENSIQFEEPNPPIQETNPPTQETNPPNMEAGGSTSGLVTLTTPMDEAPAEPMPEVEPLETPPPDSENPLGDLAKAAANQPGRKAVRKSRWRIVRMLALLVAGPIFFGVGYHITHSYSLRQIQKAQREAAEIEKSKNAPPSVPTATVNAPAPPPANSAEIDPLQGTPAHEGPKTKETLQGDLAFAMRQAGATVKRMEKGEASFFDQDLADQVKEVLRLRGELGLPNALICKPGSGPDTSGPLGTWNELQAILHPENYPGCEARLAK